MSQTAVGQKHPVSRERGREEKIIAPGEQLPGDTEAGVLKPVITFCLSIGTEGYYSLIS